MKKVTFNYSNSLDFVEKKQIMDFQERVNLCHNLLHNKTGKGNEFLGWLDLPDNYNIEEFRKIKNTAKKIQKQSDVFIVVGIGGSYLGSRAGIEMLSHSFHNEIPKSKRKGPKVYFAGHNVSATYINHLIDIIDRQDLSINVISKSGTTTEPALVFRILKEYMENKYGKEEASKRIYATTDKTKGALKELSDKEGYETFIVPDDIGGRYSVLTPVGLLPMAVAGIDIDEMMKGAQAALRDLTTSDLKENPSYQYAVIRNILYSMGKTREIMVNYEPSLFYFGQWLIQLFGESEGKDGQGIFPSSLNYTTDLHSMGQYIQDGRKDLFQTILKVEDPHEDIIIKVTDDNLDGLNYLQEKTMNFVNNKAMEGALEAHVQGGVANLIINIPEITPYYFGYLLYFFKKACAMSAYLQDINPFDQPGVEAYKRNMFKLLGKPGYKI